MEQKELKVRIKHKTDTDSNFQESDPILLDGEIVVVKTDQEGVRLKIGNGTNRYSELPFFSAGAEVEWGSWT